MQTQDLIKYVGVPFTRKGTSFTEGMDCITIIQAYYKELGHDLVLPNYENDWSTATKVKVYLETMKKLVEENQLIERVEDLEVDDLVAFGNGKKPSVVVGVCIEKGKVLYMPHLASSRLIKLNDFWKAKVRYGVRMLWV